MKKFFQILLVCTFVIGCLCITANAQDMWNEDVVYLEDMEHELIDMSALDMFRRGHYRSQHKIY